MNPAFSLILPCFNEGTILSGNLRRIHTVLDQLGNSYEIIFVDDASSDGTQHQVARICKRYPHCRAFYHEVNTGRGGAVMDGISKARGMIVGYIDIDCEVSPVYIPEIVDMIFRRNADMVIGRRIYRSSVSSIIREVLSVGYNRIVSRILDTHGFDTESGYKFFRRSKILPILPLIRDRHWFWDTEVVIWAIKKHLKIKEYPVLFLRRTDKKSSVRIISDTITYISQIIRMRHSLRSI